MRWRAPLLTLVFLAVHMFPASVPDQGGLDSTPLPSGTRTASERPDSPYRTPDTDSLIRLHLRELPPGEHTLYIHAMGKCEPSSSAPGDRVACGVRGD